MCVAATMFKFSRWSDVSELSVSVLSLISSRQYYFEILHKQDDKGSDHVEVGVSIFLDFLSDFPCIIMFFGFQSWCVWSDLVLERRTFPLLALLCFFIHLCGSDHGIKVHFKSCQYFVIFINFCLHLYLNSHSSFFLIISL